MNNLYKTIPIKYIQTYHKLLHALADYAKDMIKDCKASCCTKNINITKAKNLFNLAIHLYDSLDSTDSDNLIAVVDEILEDLFKGNTSMIVIYSDSEDMFKFYITINNNTTTIEVKDEDVELYEELYGLQTQND